MQKTFFKKIIPSMLIVAILVTGFFGGFGVGVVNAEEDLKPPSVFKQAYDINQTVGEGIYTVGEGIYKYGGLKDLIDVINIPFKWVSEQAEKLMSGFAMGMTYVTGAILGISGVLFDHVIELTVTNFKGSLDEGVIIEGWKIFRGLSNIIIIFALLVIGIATILRMENYGYKKLLGKLIAVAILINFSMFFTNIVIDSSNLLAFQFYKTAQSTGYGSISKAYLQAFKLGTLYDIQTENDKTTVEILSTKATGLEWYQILIVGTLASIMFLIVAFAFFAVSLMFVVRYVALVFLIILSPLAFVGMILPKTQNLASKWWSNLFSYAIFAPVYLLLTWFTVKFINSSAFQQGIGLEKNMSFSETTKSGVEAVGNIPLFLNFAIVIALIIGSLILAKQMGGYGSSTIISWGQSARKWGQGMTLKGAKRGTGRTAEMALDEDSWINRKTGGIFRKIANAPIVGKGFAKVSSLGKEEKDAASKKYEKAFSKYSDAGLEAVLNDRTIISETKRTAARKIWNQRKEEKDKKKELEKLITDLPKEQAKVSGYKQQIQQIDSNLVSLGTDVTAAEYELIEATKSGDALRISLATLLLNTARQNKAQKVIEKDKFTEFIKDIEKLEARKEKLEDEKARKGEMSDLKSSVSGGGGGKKSSP